MPSGGLRLPLYSKKLHIRVRLARTSCETSLTILALSLGDKVVNHLARRCGGRVSLSGGLVVFAVQLGIAYHFALARQEYQVTIVSFQLAKVHGDMTGHRRQHT